jgi:hypothetical protein
MRWLLAPLLGLALLSGIGARATAGEHPLGPEVWFIPNPNSPTADYNSLWSDGAPWQNAANMVDVLSIQQSWFEYATDAQVLTTFAFAKEHHMKVDMGVAGTTHQAPPACGNIEGYVWPGEFQANASRFQRLNLGLDSISIDGPLNFGHYTSTANGGCAYSVSDLVANMERTMAPLLQMFPSLKVYQIEQVPALNSNADWRATLSQFQDQLNKAMGRKIRGMFLDLVWDTPAFIQPIRDLRQYTRERNQRLGWYFDASSYVQSDAQWLTSAASNVDFVEGTLRIFPDEALISSWNPYPVHNLPETWPTGLTSLIDYYFSKRKTNLEVSFRGQGAMGRLSTLSDGKPIANATINGYMPGVDWTQPLPTYTFSGVVPANAAYVILAYRLNLECNCAGTNDVLIGPMQFQETQGGSANYSYLFPLGTYTFNGAPYNGARITNETVGGQPVTHIITLPTQGFGVNAGFYAVDPGASFTFTFPSATLGTGAWYGHAMFIFFDQNHNGINGGLTFPPPPGQLLTSTVTTGPDGTFLLPRLPRVGTGSNLVSVQFPGDATHRPVTWTPNQ